MSYMYELRCYSSNRRRRKTYIIYEKQYSLYCYPFFPIASVTRVTTYNIDYSMIPRRCAALYIIYIYSWYTYIRTLYKLYGCVVVLNAHVNEIWRCALSTDAWRTGVLYVLCCLTAMNQSVISDWIKHRIRRSAVAMTVHRDNR